MAVAESPVPVISHYGDLVEDLEIEFTSTNTTNKRTYVYVRISLIGGFKVPVYTCMSRVYCEFSRVCDNYISLWYLVDDLEIEFSSKSARLLKFECYCARVCEFTCMRARVSVCV